VTATATMNKRFFREKQLSGSDDGCRNSAGFGNGNHMPSGDMTNEQIQ